MLRFSDGMTFELEGKLHKEERSDGWYVIGNGMLIPMKDEQACDEYLEELKRIHRI